MNPAQQPHYLLQPPCGWGCVFCFPDQIADPCENCNITIPHHTHDVVKDVGRVAHDVIRGMYERGDGFNEFTQHNYNCGRAHVNMLGSEPDARFDEFFLVNPRTGQPAYAPGFCYTLRGNVNPGNFAASCHPNAGILDHPMRITDARRRRRLANEGNLLYATSTKPTFIDPLTAQERTSQFGERLNKIARRNRYFKVAGVCVGVLLVCVLNIILILCAEQKMIS